MSLQYARRAAERILEAIPQKGPDIDPQVIAQHLRVPVMKEELEPDVSGLLIMNGGQATIVVNKADGKGRGLSPRQRFSVAHELGHFVLKHYEKSGDHVHVDKGVRILQRGLKSTEGVDPVEIEANQFAASLLMPASRVRQQAEELGGVLIDERLVETMAETFKVSIMAMTIRLSSLGISD